MKVFLKKLAFFFIVCLFLAAPAYAATTYYASPPPSGSGTSCTVGLPCTLTTGLGKLAPGDTLLLNDGTYTEGAHIDAIPSGSSGFPTTIKAVNRGLAIYSQTGPTNGIGFNSAASWIVFDGIHFKGGSIQGYTSGSSLSVFHDITWRNNEFEGLAGALRGQGLSITGCDRCDILNNVFHDFGDPADSAAFSCALHGLCTGIYYSNYSRFGTVKGNTLYNITDYGMQISADGPPVPTPDGFIVANNIWHHLGWGSGGSTPVQSGPYFLGVNNQVYNNLVYDTGYESMVFNAIGSAGGVVIANNTLYQGHANGSAGGIDNLALTGAVCYNNLIIGYTGTATSGCDSQTGGITTGAGSTHFVDTTGNFHLIAGSSAIGAGANLSSTFPAFTTDMEGATRPSGAWDAGAYSYAAPAVNTWFVSASIGNDTSFSCTQAQSQSTPKKTIVAALGCIGAAGSSNSGAGKTVQVAAGNYTDVIDSIMPSGSGSGAVFTLKCETDFACINTLSNTAPAPYHIILNSPGSHWIVVRGFVYDGGRGPSTSGTGASFHHDISFINNELKNHLNGDGFTGSGTSHMNIIGNIIHNTGSICTGLGPGYCHGIYAADDNDNWLISGNDIYATTGYGIHIYQTTSIISSFIVERNSLHENGTVGLTGAGMIVYGDSHIIRNNLIYSNAIEGLLMRGVSNAAVYNNTFNDNGQQAISKESGVTTLCKNNLAIEDHGSSEIVGCDTLATNVTTGTAASHFANGPAANFHLVSGSSAIGTGTNLSSDSIAPFANDYAGTTRSNPWDVGAYVNAAPVIDTLAFSSQPTNVVTGATFSPTIAVTASLGGSTDTAFTGAVTLTINGCGASSTGTATRNAVAGVATFTSLGATTAASSCAFTASASGLTSVASNTFNVTASCVPHHLSFTLQPNNALVGASIGTITISVLNVSNAACGTDTSTITLATHAGTCTGMTLNGTLSGANPFTTLNANLTGAVGLCSLDATDGALIGATSNPFTISIPGSRGIAALRKR